MRKIEKFKCKCITFFVPQILARLQRYSALYFTYLKALSKDSVKSLINMSFLFMSVMKDFHIFIFIFKAWVTSWTEWSKCVVENDALWVRRSRRVSDEVAFEERGCSCPEVTGVEACNNKDHKRKSFCSIPFIFRYRKYLLDFINDFSRKIL